MNTKWVIHSLLALSLQTSTLMIARANPTPQGPPPPGYGHDDRDHDAWDMPPHEFSEIKQQGFHDGVEGARKDFDHHRAPNVNGREEYRHPHVDHSARDDYREGFRRGYESAMRHLQEH